MDYTIDEEMRSMLREAAEIGELHSDPLAPQHPRSWEAVTAGFLTHSVGSWPENFDYFWITNAGRAAIGLPVVEKISAQTWLLSKIQGAGQKAPKPTARDRVQIDGLDVARFIAALAVVYYHFGYRAVAVASDPVFALFDGATPPHPLPGAWLGWIGVQVFFVISGLVITFSAEHATPSSFFRSRVTRLLPGMAICASVIAAVDLFILQRPAGDTALLWLSSVLFNPAGPWLSGVMWTLPVEIVFYGLVWLLIRFGQTHRLERLAVVMALISAGYLASNLLNPGFIPGKVATLLLLQHGVFFSLGMLMFIVYRQGWTIRRALSIVLCVVGAALQINSVIVFKSVNEPGMGSWIDPFAAWSLMMLLTALCLAFAAAISLKVQAYRGLLRSIGLATYPLYLLHLHAGFLFIALLSSGWSLAMAVGGATLAACAASMFVALVLEPPLQARLSSAIKHLEKALAAWAIRRGQKIPVA